MLLGGGHVYDCVLQSLLVVHPDYAFCLDGLLKFIMLRLKECQLFVCRAELLLEGLVLGLKNTLATFQG